MVTACRACSLRLSLSGERRPELAEGPSCATKGPHGPHQQPPNQEPECSWSPVRKPPRFLFLKQMNEMATAGEESGLLKECGAPSARQMFANSHKEPS